MRIVVLSDHETFGGAAIAASRLSTGLIHLGAEVTRVVARPNGRSHPWRTLSLTRLMMERRVLARIAIAAQPRSFTVAQSFERASVHVAIRRILRNIEPHVINIHNLHGANISPELADVCSEYAPTVWTLHDMWSFTGHCAYTHDCRKFISGCDESCPIPNDYPAVAPQMINKMWLQRKSLFKQNARLIAVSPSHWLAKEAHAGFWKQHRVEVIPNGLPLDVYKPVSRTLAREALEIPAVGRVLLMSAQSLQESRKGAPLLLKSLELIKHRPLTLVTLGHGQLAGMNNLMHIFPMGYVDHERTKVLAYNAADFLVHPAPVDNLPNVVMEAIACGTPVVGYSVGGVPDMVRPGQSGWLAGSVNPETLAKTLERAIKELESGLDLRSECRALAEAEYGLELQAQRYLALFENLIRKSSKSEV